jgi:hypothetical protein
MFQTLQNAGSAFQFKNSFFEMQAFIAARN